MFAFFDKPSSLDVGCGGIWNANHMQNGAICDVNVFQLLFWEVKTNTQLVCLQARGWLRNCKRRVTDRNWNLRWDAGESPDSLSTSNVFIPSVEYRRGISLELSSSKAVFLTLIKVMGFCGVPFNGDLVGNLLWYANHSISQITVKQNLERVVWKWLWLYMNIYTTVLYSIEIEKQLSCLYLSRIH